MRQFIHAYTFHFFASISCLFMHSSIAYSQNLEMRIVQYNPLYRNDRNLVFRIPRRRVALFAPLNHEQPQGPKIKFEAYIWGDPSLTSEPLLIINGGPFQNATSMENMIQQLAGGERLEVGENDSILDKMQRSWGKDGLTRPIVFFDQRGTVEQNVARGSEQNIFFEAVERSTLPPFEFKDYSAIATAATNNEGRIGFAEGLTLMSNYSLKNIAFDIRELMTSLFPGKKADIVAHSFGGRISLKFVELFPEFVRSVVNIGSVVTEDPVEFMLERERHQRNLIEHSQTKTAKLLRKYLSSPLVADIYRMIEEKRIKFQITLESAASQRTVPVPEPLIFLDRLIYEVTNVNFSPAEAFYDQYLQTLHQVVTRASAGDLIEVPEGKKYPHMFASSSFQQSYFYGLGLGISMAELATKTLPEAKAQAYSYPVSESRLLLTNNPDTDMILKRFQIPADIQPDFAQVNRNLNHYKIKMSTVLGTTDALMPISLAQVQKRLLPSVNIEVVEGGTHISVLSSNALFKETRLQTIFCKHVLGL